MKYLYEGNLAIRVLNLYRNVPLILPMFTYSFTKLKVLYSQSTTFTNGRNLTTHDRITEEPS
jgi:hypothetical protein